MASIPHALNMFGGQGSGKGTQSKLIEKHFAFVHIGMGDILRTLAREDTPEGREAKKRTSAGRLVSDTLATSIVTKQLEKLSADQGFVIEGYPRTIRQAEDYRALLGKLHRLDPRPAFIHLTVPPEELRRRLDARQETEGRNDDLEHLIERRLEIYEKETKPILEAVTDWADVIEINGNQPVETVTKAILKGLGDAEA